MTVILHKEQVEKYTVGLGVYYLTKRQIFILSLQVISLLEVTSSKIKHKK